MPSAPLLVIARWYSAFMSSGVHWGRRIGHRENPHGNPAGDRERNRSKRHRVDHALAKLRYQTLIQDTKPHDPEHRSGQRRERSDDHRGLHLQELVEIQGRLQIKTAFPRNNLE